MLRKACYGVVGALTLVASLSVSVPAEGAVPDDDDVSALVPDDLRERISELNAELGIDTQWRAMLESAIDPDDYECQNDTDIRMWIGELFDAIDPGALDAVFFFGVDIWPTYYSLLFDNDSSDDYIGVNGEHTREQIKRHKDNMRFWDVKTDDILLQGMHGADIADDAKMIPVVEFLFGTDTATAQLIVDIGQDIIETEPTLNYDHPLFTLNAFAFSDEGEEIIPGFGLLPDKIVMGEGILDGLRDIGLGRNGPDVVHAHEFAHHVQFEIGAFDSDLPAPEATRRTELMADAFAGYNLAHARGASFQAKRIADVLQASFGIGDCGFTSPGHHGTPNQREAASAFGVDIATSAKPQGKIKSSSEMFDLFEAQLPILVAPDAP